MAAPQFPRSFLFISIITYLWAVIRAATELGERRSRKQSDEVIVEDLKWMNEEEEEWVM